MKRFILFILIFSFLFTACSSSVTSENIEIAKNDITVTKPTKSDITLKLVESDESDYEFVTTFTESDLAELIPDEFPKYNYASISSLDNGIIYFSTGTYSNETKYAKDVFAYDLENNNITHIANIEKLSSMLIKVYEANGNYYFYTSNLSGEMLSLYADGELTILTDDFYGPVKTEKGIAFSQTDTRSIIEFEGTNQTVITPELFPSIVLESNPLKYITIMSGVSFLNTIEDNTMASILELPSYVVVPFQDFF